MDKVLLFFFVAVCATGIEACKKDPVHCVWNAWKIGACSKECGDGTRVNKRTKSVTEKDGGSCSGKSTETVSCKEKECPVHCEWNDWVIGDCSLTCGGGMKTKTRTEKVSAKHGGETCPGDSSQDISCNTQECPVDCVWGEWESGECSEECGGGVQPMMRIKTQQAEFGGVECEGEKYNEQACNEHPCPVDCTWNDWELGECSVTCAGGTQVDIRTIATEAMHGGSCDLEDNLRVEECNTEACPIIHCEWDAWQLGECSEPCGEGTQVNTRVKLVEELNGGTCDGHPEETVECMLKECPIHCEWNDWVIGECSLECGGGIRINTRTEKVSAEHEGDECPGPSSLEESCNVDQCPVDCVWSDWTMGACSETCDEGVQNNHRTMTLEQFGGNPCEGEESEVVACNLGDCPECLDGSSWCGTYVNINAGMCSASWFTDVTGRYGCQKSCGLC